MQVKRLGFRDVLVVHLIGDQEAYSSFPRPFAFVLLVFLCPPNSTPTPLGRSQEMFSRIDPTVATAGKKEVERRRRIPESGRWHCTCTPGLAGILRPNYGRIIAHAFMQHHCAFNI